MTIKHHKKLVVTLDDEQDGDEQDSKKTILVMIYNPARSSPSFANTGSREMTRRAAPRAAPGGAAPTVGDAGERRRQGRTGEEVVEAAAKE